MKTLIKLTAGLSLALGLAAGSARATTYDFSYSFADETLVVYGTLDGTLSLDGNFIDGVNNVSMFFKGTTGPGVAVTGPVATFTNDGSTYVSGPIVSFDAGQNNFYFATTNPGELDFGSDATFLFSMSPVDGYTVGYYAPVGATNDLFDGTWTLTAESTATVPDTGGTLSLLGLSLGGLAWLQRRFRPAATAR